MKCSAVSRQLLILSISFICSIPAYTLDLPQFYRVPFFIGSPQHDMRDWTSELIFRYGTGDTRLSYNRDETKTQLLNLYGTTDVTPLAFGIEDLTMAEKPCTYEFLREEGGTIPSFDFTGTDGHLKFNGRFQTEQYDFTLYQNLFWGLFATLHIPFREVKLTDICMENLTSPANEHADDFQAFLDENFDKVLAENGYCPFATETDKSGIGDILFLLGWQGHGDEAFGSIIKDLTGAFQLGFIFPSGESDNTQKVFTLPLGYNSHLAANARGYAEGGIARYLVVGAHGAFSIFWAEQQSRRLKTNAAQQGFFTLEHGIVDVNPGILWRIGAYLKCDRPFGGLRLITGYSFTQRDRTRYTAIEPRVLSTQLAKDKMAGVFPLPSRQGIINTDKRLRRWRFHTVHFHAEYDFGAHFPNFAPIASFFYDLPVRGTRSFATDMIGGTGGLRLHLDL